MVQELCSRCLLIRQRERRASHNQIQLPLLDEALRSLTARRNLGNHIKRSRRRSSRCFDYIDNRRVHLHQPVTDHIPSQHDRHRKPIEANFDELWECLVPQGYIEGVCPLRQTNKDNPLFSSLMEDLEAAAFCNCQSVGVLQKSLEHFTQIEDIDNSWSTYDS